MFVWRSGIRSQMVLAPHFACLYQMHVIGIRDTESHNHHSLNQYRLDFIIAGFRSISPPFIPPPSTKSCSLSQCGIFHNRTRCSNGGKIEQLCKVSLGEVHSSIHHCCTGICSFWTVDTRDLCSEGDVRREIVFPRIGQRKIIWVIILEWTRVRRLRSCDVSSQKSILTYCTVLTPCVQ